MNATTRGPDTLQVALLTIKMEKDAVDRIRVAAAGMPWTIIEADFQYYFSTDQRPYFNQKALDAQACLAIIDFDPDPGLALKTTEFLRSSFYHKVAIVAVSTATDPNLLLQAMRAGCSDFLSGPLNDDEFKDTLTRLEHRWSAIIAHPLDAGKIISFFGAKGGVGTTTLAVHLAMFLVKSCRKKVLLIDNHDQLGHIALYLGLDGTHHAFHELVTNISRLDQELLRGFIVTHPSGLDILSSPDVYGGDKNADAEAVEQTLVFLSSQYDFVMLDCEASFEEINLAIIDLSTWVYLVATPEIGAIRDLSRYVDGLVQNEQATDKLQVVINRYASSEAVSIEQIEKAIRLPIAIKIPNYYSELVKAINTGEPLGFERTSEFTKQMMKWATSLAGTRQPVIPEPHKRWFALW